MLSSTQLQTSAPTTIPSSPARSSLDAQITTLRGQLKEWEKRFSLRHSGRKAGREDIKADGPDGIGKVYKEYNRLRDVLDGKAPVDGRKDRKPKIREAQKVPKASPKKRKTATFEGDLSNSQRGSATATPRKSHQIHPSDLDPYDPPNSITPRPLRAYIGPTPQRDGKVLGLFDLLSGSSKATPSTSTRKKRKADALSEGTGNVVQTPSRRKSDILQFLDGDEGAGNHTGKRQRFERTPASEGKKFLLSQFFATPSTTRFMGNGELGEDGNVDKTPLRTRLLAGRAPVMMENVPDAEQPGPDSTPPFLRRTTSLNQRLKAAETDHPFASPEKVRTGPPRLSLFRKGKSLSEIVKDLRKAQDEEHDDDLEALNDMEDGGGTDDDNDPVEDGQKVGPQQEQEGQQPQRVWKKKGQKRTTRRVNMKPPTARTKSKRPEAEESSDSEDELAGAGIEDTQNGIDGGGFDLDSLDEAEVDRERPTGKSSKKAKKNEGPTRGRKVKANAISHMNFRSLKIKNKNSKAKGRGFGGRGRR